MYNLISFHRLPTEPMRTEHIQQVQPQTHSYNSKISSQPTQRPLSLLGSALQILKSFHKSTSISPTQYPYYENYYAKLESNRDKEYSYNNGANNKWNYVSEARTIQPVESNTFKNKVVTYGSNIENSQSIGDNSYRRKLPAYSTSEENNFSPPNTTFRVNGIALDRPRYGFIENKELSERGGGKREGISPITKTTKDRNTTTERGETNSTITDNPIKTSNDNSTNLTKNSSSNTTNDNSTKTTKDNSAKTTTRHEETNVIDTGKLTPTKRKKKQRKNKKLNKKYKNKEDHQNSKNKETLSNETNTLKTSRERVNNESAKIHKLSNNTITQPNNTNNNSSNSASEPQPPVSKITGYATNLIKNNSESLQYQTLEERRDNRTQQSHIDMMNVKSSHHENTQSEMDIENITIATTKGIVPPSSSLNFTSNTPPQAVSTNNVLEKSSASSVKENINKTESLEFRNDQTKSNLESKKPLVDTTSTADQMKPSQTLIHIEIKHAPISKGAIGASKDLTPSIRHNIEINSEDASELLLNLLKMKKSKSILSDDLDDVDDRPAVDPRILDLLKLREEREREIDQTIKKYFNDVNNLQSTTTSSDDDLITTAQTPVPVFSARDLRLLRRMVENSKNKKRSGLNNPASTLWEKMLELTAERKNTQQEKGKIVERMASRKKLAEGDSTLAKEIMKNVNNIDSFSFDSKPNPFLKLIKKQALKKLQNFYLATTTNNKLDLRKSRKNLEEIMPDENGVPAFDRFNKNNDDNNNNNNIHKQGSRRQYVWNGATFVPVEDRSAPSSYLNTDQSLGERRVYKWNGVSFVENNEVGHLGSPDSVPTASSTPTNQNTASYSPTNHIPSSYLQTNHMEASTQSSEMSAQDVQDILSQWNGEQRIRLAPQRNAIETSSSRSEPRKPVLANHEITEAPTKTTTSPKETVYEKDPTDDQVLYYWNGASYQPVQKAEKLAPNTVKYKPTANGGFELFLTDRRTQQLDDTRLAKQREAILPTKPSESSNLQNLDLRKIENILQVHYPANERTSPTFPSSLPPSLSPMIKPLIQEPFNPYVPPQKKFNQVNDESANGLVNQQQPQPQQQPSPQQPPPPPPPQQQQQQQQPSPQQQHQQPSPLPSPSPPQPQQQQQPSPPQQPPPPPPHQDLTKYDNTNKSLNNPAKSDTEELEQVVANDLNIKQAINALTRIFTTEDDSNEESQASR